MINLLPRILGGVAGVALIACWLLFSAWQGSRDRVAELEARLQAQVDATVICSNANDTNQTTIEALRSRLEDLVNQRRADEAERELLLEERNNERAERERLADELERERDNEVLTDDDCRAFMAQRVADSCPATADQLRERSRGPRSN